MFFVKGIKKNPTYYFDAGAFNRIMDEEAKLAEYPWSWPIAKEMFGIAYQISEVARSSAVSRSYNNRYGMTRDRVTYESVSAHTNLVCEILDQALDYLFGVDFDFTPDGYDRTTIHRVARRHDLPENEIDDQADNGNRDDLGLAVLEHRYWDDYSRHSSLGKAKSEDLIHALTREMEAKSSVTGRLIYLADKVSALIVTLCYDQLGRPPLMSKYNLRASKKDRKEMDLCDRTIRGKYRASEMWSIDYFKIRQFTKYDESGFFTALLVMYTLIVNNCWYNWREQDYLK